MNNGSYHSTTIFIKRSFLVAPLTTVALLHFSRDFTFSLLSRFSVGKTNSHCEKKSTEGHQTKNENSLNCDRKQLILDSDSLESIFRLFTGFSKKKKKKKFNAFVRGVRLLKYKRPPVINETKKKKRKNVFVYSVSTQTCIIDPTGKRRHII
ncbi:hypothetical protein PUN28_015623 [Cardiocondyla obscurior]|uniref:Uncharacterized protein n=1 Tax=Cardiocondyla obscurior TaxID=286306 RepID=A0AAW2EXT7_9HYME